MSATFRSVALQTRLVLIEGAQMGLYFVFIIVLYVEAETFASYAQLLLQTMGNVLTS